MAKAYSMGYFTNGDGAINGVEYSQDFARLQKAVEEQKEQNQELTELFQDYMDGLCERFDSDEEMLAAKLDENLLVMKAVSKQLDTLIELVGEIGEKLDT